MARLQEIVDQANGHVGDLFAELSRQTELLKAIRDTVTPDEDAIEETILTRFIQVANSGSNNANQFLSVPLGFNLQLQHIHVQVGGGAGGFLFVHVDENEGQQVSFGKVVLGGPITNNQFYTQTGLQLWLPQRAKLSISGPAAVPNFNVFVQGKLIGIEAKEHAIEGGGPL